MKTLDEVIKAFEICVGYHCSNAEFDVCPYLGESDMGCMKEPEKDALHYLKEYREKSHQLDIGIAENRRFFEQYGEEMQRIHEIEDEYHELKDWWAEEYVTNDPLTWDELKQMEGKPVWVEFEKNGNHWLIITDIKSNGAVGRGVYGENAPLYKDRIGTDWQAYRKER